MLTVIFVYYARSVAKCVSLSNDVREILLYVVEIKLGYDLRAIYGHSISIYGHAVTIYGHNDGGKIVKYGDNIQKEKKRRKVVQAD